MSENDFRKVFSNNLQHYMDMRGIKQADIVKHFNIAKSTVSSWCNGLKIPRMDKIEMLASFLEVNKADLLDENRYMPRNAMPVPDVPIVQIPIIGRVAAGLNCLAEENIIDYEPVFSSEINPAEQYVYLKVIGDSMYPKLEEGDLVLVQCLDSVDSGSYAVVIVDNEDGVIKRVVYDKDYIELQSINPMYPPRRFEGRDVTRIRVFGLVKEVKRKF